jgi:hypothetical protein
LIAPYGLRLGKIGLDRGYRSASPYTDALDAKTNRSIEVSRHASSNRWVARMLQES